MQYNLAALDLIHDVLVATFWVVGVGAAALIALNYWYWRKR